MNATETTGLLNSKNGGKRSLVDAREAYKSNNSELSKQIHLKKSIQTVIFLVLS